MVMHSIGKRQVTPTRQQQVDETRAAIVAAARRIIDERGVERLSMRTLGSAVGLNAATLYGYFSSKEAVLNHIFDEKVLGCGTAMHNAAIDSAPGIDRLLAVSVAFWGYCLANPDFQYLFGQTRDVSAAAREYRRSVAVDLVQSFAPLVEEAIALGHIEPVDAAKATIDMWVVLHGYISLTLEGSHPMCGRPAEEQEAAFRGFALVSLRWAGRRIVQ